MVRPQKDRSPTFWGQFLLGRGLTEKAISPSKEYRVAEIRLVLIWR